MLRRLVTWSYDHRRRVVGLWVAALVLATLVAAVAGGEDEVDYSVPGSDSAAAVDLLDERFPELAGSTVDLVYAAPAGADDPQVAGRVADLTGEVERIDHVAGVDPAVISPDGTTGIVRVHMDLPGEQLPPEPVERMIELAAEADGRGLQIELGGFPVEDVEARDAGSESAGIVAAAVILLVAFGSALAAGLPLVVAGLGLGVALALVALLSNLLSVPDWSVQIATMIGIGVGIDYALFIVTRYRSALASGRTPREAVVIAGGTAGRAVVFAGTTVVVSLSGLLLMGRDYLWGVAAATSLAVLVVVVASVTVLPALLGFAGRSIDRLRMPWFRHDVADRRTVSWRWSRVMQRRPLLAGLTALVILLALAAPITDLRLGTPDAGNGSTDLTSRRAFDLVSDGFGPGANGPLLVAVDLEDPAGGAGTAAAGAADEPIAADGDATGAVGESAGAASGATDDAGSAAERAARATAASIAQTIGRTDGVAAVLPPEVARSGDAVAMMVIPETGPQDRATERLVHALRDDVLPAAVEGTGAEASVGGTTAMFIDDSDQTGSRLPLFIGGVVLLSFLLLMSVFRSLAVAVKAAVMNLLSIGAAYGVMGLAASGGWFGELVGIESATPVPAWLPMMMFAVLFGLSMDYEVFLLSRMREEYVRTGDNRSAVADGLASTARVITAAAAIMVTVFGAFILEDAVVLKVAGIGLAAAIFVDATVVRMVLVPATMELLGDRNWWLPRWLDRLLPHVDVEGSDVADLRAAPPAEEAERVPAGVG